jgi:thiol-disulfide isomerase/thioredoxin/DNA-binding beta-propeller fold protein YncE
MGAVRTFMATRTRPRRSTIAFLLALLAGSASLRARGEDGFTASDAHRALVASTEWLNVSRVPTAEELSGRIVLLDFWCFCCINCMHVIPDLKALEKEFGSNLTVIGVHSAKFSNEKETGNIRAAVLRYELEHPVINDGDFRLWKSFKVSSWPSLVLINPRGEIESVYKGEGHRREIERDVQRLIKENAGKLRTDPLPIALEKNKLGASPLRFPGKLAFAPDRQLLYVSDSNHERIVALRLTGEIVDSIGRKDAPGKADGSFEEATFHRPQGLLYAKGALYVADTENHLLRKVDLGARKVTTLAGTGVQGYERRASHAPALETPLSSPWDVAFDAGRDRILIAMAGIHQLWEYDLAAATVSVVAGNARESIVDGPLPNNSLSQPSGVSLLGDKLYFVDSETSSLRVLQSGNLRTLLGKGLFDFGLKDGAKDTARLQHPLGLAATEGAVFIADSYNHAIRRYDLASKTIETLAGDGTPGVADGPFASARFSEPAGVAAIGSRLYVTDTNNHRIRILDLDARTVSTLAVTEGGPAKPSHDKPADSLPLLEKTEDASVAAGQEIVLRVVVAKGFHLSPDAPSWLAIYRRAADGGATLVREVDAPAELAKDMTLPALRAGESYRVQTTLSYCKDASASGGECLLRSFDRVIAAVEGGAAAPVELSLK